MAKDRNAIKLPTTLQNMHCLSSNNTPWLCSQSKKAGNSQGKTNLQMFITNPEHSNVHYKMQLEKKM